jgi:hypothetical protein
MAEEKTYQIGGETYTQRKLVLGQIQQLLGVIEGIALPADMAPAGLMYALKDRIHEALAIVLREKEKPLKDKDIAALAETIRFEISPEATLEIIEDFFVFTPISSLLDSMLRVIGTVTEKINGAMAEIAAKTQSAQ